jgi:hypothetical protein
MDQNLNAVKVSGTGSVKGDRTRVRGLYFVSTAVAGSIVLKDGGASGTTLIDLDTPALLDGYYIDLPGSVAFETDCHATLTNVTSVTVFY